jgi:hypothetical protein
MSLYFERIRRKNNPLRSQFFGRSRCCHRACMRFRRNGRKNDLKILQSYVRRMRLMMNPRMSLMKMSFLSCRRFPSLIPSLFVLNEVSQPFFYPFILSINNPCCPDERTAGRKII